MSLRDEIATILNYIAEQLPSPGGSGYPQQSSRDAVVEADRNASVNRNK
jgi:hypothetical protein